MKIGVITDCFKLPLDESIKLAGKLGFDGIQIYATTGEFSPEVLTTERKSEVRSLLMENHLEISALCGDMGGYGFQIESDNAERIQKTKRIIDLAEEFEVGVITTHIGVIPENKDNPRYSVMLDAMCKCGEYAADKKITLAIETGPEKASTLLSFLQDTNGGIGVNLDPANLRMVSCVDPVHAVEVLGRYIVHTHAKDGINLFPGSAAAAYGMVNPDGTKRDLGVEPARYKEVPLGQGQVPWDGYLAALKKIGYDGFLTIERECGDDPAGDIRLAQKFLLEKLG